MQCAIILVMRLCPKCFSKEYNKKGWIKTKKNPKPIRQYECRSCRARFTVNSLSVSKKHKKPHLNQKIMTLYCEGNTLRGIARILKCSYTTVVRKFRFMAHLARTRHLKALSEKGILTTYVQVDELETFETTKNRPLGVALSVRKKTGEIISARVCRIPMKAHSVPYRAKKEYAKLSTRDHAMTEMLVETTKALAPGVNTIIACDGDKKLYKMSELICPDSTIKSFPLNHDDLWRLNHVCAKMRHHMSRLRRKTWATTKRMDQLQMHLDLFIAYNNDYNLE